MFEEQIQSEKAEPGLMCYLEEFFEDRVNDLELMKDCLESNNFKDISDCAHHLKGFCGPYGFNHMGHLAKELEMTSKEEDAIKTKELLMLMGQYLEEKIKFMH